MRDFAAIVDALRLCVKYRNAENALANAENAADAIEELVAAVPKWISAKKPPEKPDFYWCNMENTVFPGRYYQEKLWYDGEYFVNVDGIVPLHVTHYMPLPAPPKEENDEH